ncbi:MAG: cation-translocating P-type ATPase [Bdellovibrionales bacterium]|nr:cation-translocating P-type ATPase [Bdellovibrionales bacterium]
MSGQALGLSGEEAARRASRFGPNEIRRERARSPRVLLAQQFESPLVLILVAACALSAALGEWAEAVAIAAILLLNALIGFFQEYRAENAIHALRNMTAPRATVVRDGRALVIPARDIVPGDLLALEPGDVVAADARLREASRLQLNEAVLTGESLPVDKTAPDDRVFMGTIVATGTARAEVTETGMATELGKIAHLITTAQESPTPLQVQLALVGRRLLVLCLGVVGLVLVMGLWQGRPWMELLVFAVSLAVAAVPEGLPAIVTVALALGVQRMGARRALVRKLPSVETLGSVTVICTDKTGTLTTGRMRVREIWGADPGALILSAASCCDAELGAEGDEGTGDPTELAILRFARERGVFRGEIERRNPRVSTEPFDAATKRMAVTRADGLTYVKGAAEALIAASRMDAQARGLAEAALRDFAERGLRVLAVARGRGGADQDLEVLGLLGLADPPRPEAAQAIADARGAGITPVMITGDHPATASAIARELGLLIGEETPEGRVHARATPEDKIQLVRAWKARGAVVAMTGDGVNDAPALREAHIGIAMGKAGTEVTRQSADLVLGDDNFATIVAAVREGRGIFQNIRKAAVYLLTGNFAELLVVVGASLLGWPLPFLASHLLWINLVTDSLPALALIAEPVASDVMQRPPRPPQESLLGRAEWRRVVVVGTFEAALVLAVFWRALGEEDLEWARSLAFTTLVFSQMWRSFAARSSTRVFWSVGAWSNLWLLGVVVLTGTLQLALHYLPPAQAVFGLGPLGIADLGLILGVSLIPVTVIELSKLLGKLSVTDLAA